MLEGKNPTVTKANIRHRNGRTNIWIEKSMSNKTPHERPREERFVARSYLVVPASDAHMVQKALASDSDQVVIDLEDAVAIAAKDEARRSLSDTLAAAAPGRVLVRVNAPGTPWCHLDISACAKLPAVHSIVVPKVSNAGDLAFVDRLISGIEAGGVRTTQLEVHALIETAEGLVNLNDIVNATPRLTAIVLGYADLAASLGLPQIPSTLASELWMSVQQRIVETARSAGIAPVTGPYLGVDDGSDFVDSITRTATVGFDGAWVIHPRQVDEVNVQFSPAPAQLERAKAIIEALAEAELTGRGAAALDGQMLDEAVALGARRLLSRARTTDAGVTV